MRRIQLYDTTLRDGTQAEDISFTLEDKLRIAERLDDLGLHYIEGGWPGSNPRDEEFFRAVKRLALKHAKVAAFGSTRRAGVKAADDRNLGLCLRAETAVVTIVGKTWDLHVREDLRIPLAENLEVIHDSVAYLRKRTDEVVFDAEHFFDGLAADRDYALACVRTAADAAATRRGAEATDPRRALRPGPGRQQPAPGGPRPGPALEPPLPGRPARPRPRVEPAGGDDAAARPEGPRGEGLRLRGRRGVVRAPHAQGDRRRPRALLPPDRLSRDRREADRGRAADRRGDHHAGRPGRADRAHGGAGERAGQRPRPRAAQGPRQVLPRGRARPAPRLQGARARQRGGDRGGGARTHRVGGRARALGDGGRVAQRDRGELAGPGRQHGLQALQGAPGRSPPPPGRGRHAPRLTRAVPRTPCASTSITTRRRRSGPRCARPCCASSDRPRTPRAHTARGRADRKSTRLNSSHTVISYAVFCL